MGYVKIFNLEFSLYCNRSRYRYEKERPSEFPVISGLLTWNSHAFLFISRITYEATFFLHFANLIFSGFFFSQRQKRNHEKAIFWQSWEPRISIFFLFWVRQLWLSLWRLLCFESCWASNSFAINRFFALENRVGVLYVFLIRELLGRNGCMHAWNFGYPTVKLNQPYSTSPASKLHLPNNRRNFKLELSKLQSLWKKITLQTSAP